MNMITVVGLFDHYSDADDAVHALQDYGVASNRISIVTRDNDTIERGTLARAGLAGGAATGGMVGLLAGLSAMVVPGIGPVIATGTLAAALAAAIGMTAAGAGIGAAAGGLLGALVDLGLSEQDADFFAEGVKRGGIVVLVEADVEDDDEISDILNGAGAVDVHIRRRSWQNAGWIPFAEAERSGEDAYRR